MDITPLYELKDRLRTAAIAGTALISEDFRLKKAAENFKALEGASPVFKKVGELTAALISDDCSDRAGTLLDTVTLVDSVICTLGATAVKGEVCDLPITETSSAVVEAPYSRLSMLVDALTKSGSGNMQTVSDAWKTSPELFRDFRVKPALVKGLGASYSELADYVIEIVSSVGKEMLPLLKKDFDPDGKKEMVRRVIAIDKIGGASENDFYLEQLENAKKDVRKFLIYALRHDPDNADKLIALSKTEKSKLKDAAIMALGMMDCEKAEKYYLELAKTPDKLLPYLEDAAAEWAGPLTARLIDKLLVDENGNKVTLSQFHADPKIKLKTPVTFTALKEALYKKRGAEIEQIYRDFRLTVTNTPADREMDQCLHLSIYSTRDKGLMKLAIELNNAPETKGRYACSEAMARLLGEEDCSQWLETSLAEVDKKIRTDVKFDKYASLLETLQWLRFKDGEYVLERFRYDPLSDTRSVESIPIKQPVREKFIDILMKYDNPVFTNLISYLTDRDDKEMCKKIGEHYIHMMTTVPGIDNGVAILLDHCGYYNVDGLLGGWVRMNPKANKYNILRFIEFMPGDLAFKMAQARDVVEQMKSGKIKTELPVEDMDWLLNWVEYDLK